MISDGAAVIRNVSRETQAALEIYAELLRKWSTTINLVAPNTLNDLYIRHFADSLQLLKFLPKSARVWADLGSGAGFPGLVVAIAARDVQPGLEVHLVESDQRKATFLRTVSRETQTPVVVHATRTENLEPLGADVVSARALAPLSGLFSMVKRHLGQGGVALLPKGKSYESELLVARETWRFSLRATPSETDPDAAVLKIGDLCHV